MASYSLVLKSSVEKDLRPLPRPILKRVWAKVQALSQEPIPRQSTKLAGAERLYRQRFGDYRIIYAVDTTRGKLPSTTFVTGVRPTAVSE